MRYLRQSTSVDLPIGPFLDNIDGFTAETALTLTQPDIRLKKNGAAWAQKAAAQTLSHEEAGWYEVTLDATDTDTCGQLMLSVQETGALPVWCEFHVLEEAVYDALFAASAPGYVSNAPVNVAQFGGTNLTASAGRPEVNASHWAGTAVASAVLLAAANIASDAFTAAKFAASSLNGKGDWNIGKTGYALSTAGVQAIWDALTSALTTVGSIGKLLVDNVNATISSRSSHSAADVWAAATRLLTAGTNIVLAKGTGVTGFNDLSAAQVNAEADTALSDYDPPTRAELTSDTNSVLARVSPIVTKTGAVVSDGGNSATSFVTDLTETATDYWKDAFLRITSGVLINQVKKITGYNGTTKAVTVLGGFTGTPATGVTFEIVND